MGRRLTAGRNFGDKTIGHAALFVKDGFVVIWRFVIEAYWRLWSVSIQSWILMSSHQFAAKTRVLSLNLQSLGVHVGVVAGVVVAVEEQGVPVDVARTAKRH